MGKKRELEVPQASSPTHSSDTNNVNGKIRIVRGSYWKHGQLNYYFLINGDINNLRTHLKINK
jgi:hypothetical protein